MSSNECQNCRKLNDVINEQKSKISLIEVRLKDLVKAYKKVCLERDNLLAISSSAVLPLNDSHEQQKRITDLEARVAEMSAICGNYESQKIRDKQLIEELTQKYEQIVTELAKSRKLLQKTPEEQNKPQKTLKSRGIQTEESIEWTGDEDRDCSHELSNERQIVGRDVETQTDLVPEMDVFNGNNRKKCELAVVLPTVSETQQKNDSETEEHSNHSRSPSQSSDNYSVFAQNEREMHENNEVKHSAPNPSGISLFYANELARKEIDLAETRLQAREYECALRELKWKYNTEKYRYNSIDTHFYLLIFH